MPHRKLVFLLTFPHRRDHSTFRAERLSLRSDLANNLGENGLERETPRQRSCRVSIPSRRWYLALHLQSAKPIESIPEFAQSTSLAAHSAAGRANCATCRPV